MGLDLRASVATAVVILVGCVSISVVHAQSDPATKCFSRRADLSVDERIDACTKDIADGAGKIVATRPAYFRRAATYVSQGKYDLAILDYEQILQHYPEDYLVRAGLARAYVQKADFARAIVEFTKLIELRPQSLQGYVDRGVAYYQNHEFDRAIDDYNQAIKLDSKNGIAYGLRGVAFAAKGDSDRASEDCNRAIELSPKLGMAYACQGSVLFEKGDVDLAIADLNQAIDLNPQDVSAHIVRGEAYRQKNIEDKALADFDRAVELSGSAEAYAYRARFYRDRDRAHSLADLSEAVQRKPNDPSLHFNRGVAYFQDGALSEALEDFSRSHELQPKRAYASLWIDLLRRRLGKPSELAEATQQLDMTLWPAPVVHFLLGDMTQDAMFAAAEDADPKKRQGQVCEANFYAGELALQGGAAEEAQRFLKCVADDCPKAFVEALAANSELKTLAAKRSER